MVSHYCLTLKKQFFFLSVDRSTKGHILGVPQKSIAERDLSPATVSLLRIILHSAMLAVSYTHLTLPTKRIV